MRQLRKPTTAERATVDLQMREIVAAELGAPAGAIRRVQLSLPSAPRVGISIDTPTPQQAGPGRDYKLVQLPADTVVEFWLQPSQRVFAAAISGTGGFAQLGLITEYFDEEAP